MQYIIDANVLIGILEKKQSQKTQILSKLQEDPTNALCTCDIILAEVRSGLSDKDFIEAASFLFRLKFLIVKRESSLRAGEIFYRLARRGETIPLADCLIAATAEFYKGTVVTSDKRHFQKLEPSVPVLYL